MEGGDVGSKARVSGAGLLRQVACCLMVSLAPLNAGMIVGWLSPIALKLLNDDSPVEVMTKEQISVLGSIAYYPMVVYAFALSYVSDKYGRKPCLLILGIPNVISGLTLMFATTSTTLYIGRLLSGLRSNGVLMSGMYISEIVDGSIRGMMITLCSVQINVGVLLSYVAGNTLSYKAYNAIMAAVPAIFTLLMIWIPESPQFLMSKGRKEEAKKSLLWLGAGDEAAAQRELEVLMPAGDFSSTTSITAIRQGMFHLFKSRRAKKALAISVIASQLQMTTGINLVVGYSGIIFKEAGSPLSPEDSSIVMAVIIITASLISFVVVDKLGRKPLMYVSFTAGAVSMSTVSIFLYVKMIGVDVSDFIWIPITTIGVFVFAFALGVSSLPGVITNEVCSPEIKPAVLSINTVSMVLCIAAVFLSFPYMHRHLGLYSTFAVPAVINVFGIFFTRFMLPETKGKTLKEISLELGKK